MPAQNLMLIVAGACVVVALSVAVTVYLLRTPHPPEKPASVVASTPVAPATATTPEPQATAAPVVAMPTIAADAPVEVKTEPVVSEQVEVEPEPAPIVIAQPLPEPPPPAAPATVIRPDVNVYTFIDGLQVMGVRFSGASSKVLMNNRVYRVNDIVDRPLGLRLTAVTENSLTFVDANGASYIKNF